MLKGLNEDIALPLLLGRPSITPGVTDLESLRGKTVLVTGAGGSIGSEIVKQVLECSPHHIIMVDLSEYNLYEITLTAENSGQKSKVTPLVADIRHEWVMRDVFKKFKPHIVIHAAALKHVPLMEVPHNMIEAVRTNTIGTWQLAIMADENGCEQFLMVSTDKAVEPSSVMGLSKRAAELAVMDFVQEARPKCVYKAVRFGNVLGSSGSVVPLFRRQIAKGGPITVTHKDMTRYFMTIAEAVSLVLASLDLKGADEFNLYMLDMGEPVKISSLAEQLIRMSGLRPHKDIKIEYTGLRPGEKMSESLRYPYEEQSPSATDGILQLIAPNKYVAGSVSALISSTIERDADKVFAALMLAVPDNKVQGD